MTAHDIRKEARQLLKTLVGKYKLFLIPILATFFSGGLQFKMQWEIQQQMAELNDPTATVSTSTGVGGDIFSQLLAFFITVLFMSAAYTVLEVYRQKRTEATYEDSLRAFSSPYLFRLFLISLCQFLLLLPWVLLMFAPLVGLALYAFFSLSSGDIAMDGSLGFFLIPVIIGFIMSIIKTYAYSQANYILYDRIAEGGNLNPFDIIKESVQLMKGKKFDLFILNLSFIGWYILIPLTLGLAAFYVLPYSWTANTIFYDNLKNPKDA